jgi:hypothetical protein
MSQDVRVVVQSTTYRSPPVVAQPEALVRLELEGGKVVWWERYREGGRGEPTGAAGAADRTTNT